MNVFFGIFRPSFGLLPASAASQYWQSNQTDLKVFLGFLALGILAIGIVALSIYLAPILFPVEVAALVDAGVASAPALLARAALLVDRFAAALPTVLATSQMAVTGAIDVGSGLRLVAGR